ncbi:Prolyl 4-hydroxylase [Mactra antiquata]
MKISKNFLFCLICVWIETGLSKLYLTQFEIKTILKTEREIWTSLTGYVTRQEKRGISFEPHVKEFLDYIDEANNASTETNGTENPLSVFYILYRAVNEWEEFAKTMSCDPEVEECPILTGEDVINVVKRRQKSPWPIERDVKHAAQALLNVWTIYDLDFENLLKGNLGNVSEKPLTGDQIFFIANAARDAGMLYEAITWYEYLQKNMDSSDDVTFKASVLSRRLGMSYHEFGMTEKAKEILTKMSELDPDDKGVKQDLEYLESRDKDNGETELVRYQKNDTSKSTIVLQEYEKLCRTTAQGELHYNWNLTCFLVPLSKWYGTVKVELISKRPRIEIVHDVMSGEECDTVISYSDIFFRKAEIVTGQEKFISSAMCEHNTRSPFIKTLTRRLARMTRFQLYQKNRVTSSQCYQLINEGVGTTSHPTADYWPDDFRPHPFAGNRLATIHMQLSDIQYGGALIFPRANITVPLQKGSAVIWWNLQRSGKPSIRSTYHNCPILQGSQWALVKGILYTNQMFARNCEV